MSNEELITRCCQVFCQFSEDPTEDNLMKYYKYKSELLDQLRAGNEAIKIVDSIREKYNLAA